MTNKSRPVKIFHMERLVNLFSDFDFEAGEMYLDASQDTDTSVHWTYWLQVQFNGMNYQWPVTWCSLGDLMMPQGNFIRSILGENLLLAPILMLPIKLVVWRVAWCYCLYWEVKLIQQKLNSNEFEVWLAYITSLLIFEQVAPSTNLSKLFDFEEHFLKWILLRIQQRKVTLNLFRECSCRHFACS